MPVLASFMVPHPPLIVPAVGRGGQKQILKTTVAYEEVADEIAALRPDTIIISSPHSVMYADYFHISPGPGASGSFAGFGAPEISFREEYDMDLVSKIEEVAMQNDFPAGSLGERDRSLDHGTMVPLYFIREKYQGGKIIRIGLSGLSLPRHYEFGQLIKEAVDLCGTRAVYVASGDLSHKLKEDGPYGYVPEGPVYDRRIMDVCSRAAFGEMFDFDEAFCEKAAECGHRSFVIMAGVLDGMSVRAKQLSHEDITGVGYGICTFYPENEAEDRHFLAQYLEKVEEKLMERKLNEDPYVSLARNSLEAYIRHGITIRVPDRLPEEMKETQAGAFVSIHEHGRLRGCIGTIMPTRDNVAEEIIHNAISASTADPRFDPIVEEELPWLEISVDVLGKPEAIESTDQLDVKRYGVIVSHGRKRGLLLPDLDGVDTPQQQVDIARQKGGIREDESFSLERFEVIRHH